MARKSDFNWELCLEICEQIATGGNIVDVLDSNSDYPSWSTFRRWKRENSELQTLYINAIQDKSEALISEMDATMQDLREKVIDPATANVLIQTLKWKCAKFYPKMFGEKVMNEVTIVPEQPLFPEQDA